MTHHLSKCLRGLLTIAICGATGGCRTTRVDRTEGFLGEGAASYYGKAFHGRQTASRERFNLESLTAAHRHLRFGTCVRVEHVGNGRTVNVRVNDRGPSSRERIIDVSEGAARRLGMLADGIARVRLFTCH